MNPNTPQCCSLTSSRTRKKVVTTYPLT